MTGYLVQLSFNQSTKRLISIGFAAAACMPAFAAPTAVTHQIRDVVVAPDKSLTLKTTFDMQYRSEDGGAEWHAEYGDGYIFWDVVGKQDEFHRVSRMARTINPAHDPIPSLGPYAGIGTKYLACFESRLYSSSNFGMSWFAQGPLPGNVESCSALTAVADTFYMGTVQGLYQARTNDKEWHLVSALGNKPIQQLFVGERQRLFANVTESGQCCASYLSVDAGKSWKPVTLPPQNALGRTYRVVGVVNGVIFASLDGNLVSSANEGATWSAPQKGLLITTGKKTQGVKRIQKVLDGGDGILYAFSGGALFKRMPSDADWKRVPLERMKLDKDS